MSRAKVPAVCPHRFLMIEGIDRRQSVETSRWYHCGTPVTRPFPMPLSTWFSFPRKNLHLVHETKAGYRAGYRTAAAGRLASLAV